MSVTPDLWNLLFAYMPLRIQLTDRGRLILTALIMAMIVGSMIVVAAVYVPTNYTDRIQGKWIRFSFITVFFAVLLLRMYWHARKSVAFWCIFLGALVCHSLGVGYFFYAGAGLSTLMAGAVGGLEGICVAVIIHWILGIAPNLHPWRSRSPWIPTV